MIQIWGRQKPIKAKKTVNTRLANLAAARTKGETPAANTNVKVDHGFYMNLDSKEFPKWLIS